MRFATLHGGRTKSGNNHLKWTPAAFAFVFVFVFVAVVVAVYFTRGLRFLCFDVPQINCLQLGALANVTQPFPLPPLLARPTLTVLAVVCSVGLKA